MYENSLIEACLHVVHVRCESRVILPDFLPDGSPVTSDLAPRRPLMNLNLHQRAIKWFSAEAGLAVVWLPDYAVVPIRLHRCGHHLTHLAEGRLERNKLEV